MCRHLAYLGPAVTLADCVLHQPHSLMKQSWAPTDMRGGGTINADGFGIGWLLDAGSRDGGSVARRYRSDRPIWSDPSLPGLAASVSSGAILAAVRSATVGMPVIETACAPFVDGSWMFSHNGVVDGWPASVAPLSRALPQTVLLTLEAPTDSAFLWALVREHLRSGRPPATAVADVVASVLALAPRSRLNLLLHDGLQITATTVGHSLWLHDGAEGSVAVSSEPLDPDDKRWQPVPDLCLLEAAAGQSSIRPLSSIPAPSSIPTLSSIPAPSSIPALSPIPPLSSARPLSDPPTARSTPRPRMVMPAPVVDIHLTPDHAEQSLRLDVRLGLTSRSKWLPSKWFYDARGSVLFEEITRLPEYYPTRTERSILAAHAADIARRTGAHTLVELGSGSSEKTRLLLDALQAGGTLREYVPLDVSETALRDAVNVMHDDYPMLAVHGVVGDFTRHLDRIPGQSPRMVIFLGGTIGNLFPEERASFLGELRDTLTPGEWLLLGTDLVKDPDVLVAAYDDAAGVTAQFNRNILAVLNREVGADFDLEAYQHVAIWDPANEWVEMRLRSTRATEVTMAGLSLDIVLQANEEIRTEISAKFRREGVEGELAKAGFGLDSWWTDPDGRFALSLARAL